MRVYSQLERARCHVLIRDQQIMKEPLRRTFLGERLSPELPNEKLDLSKVSQAGWSSQSSLHSTTGPRVLPSSVANKLQNQVCKVLDSQYYYNRTLEALNRGRGVHIGKHICLSVS